MTSFECKVSDLNKESTFPEKTDNNFKTEPQKTQELDFSNSKTLFEFLDNIDNIKAFIVTLLVYLILHSELFINILVNTFDFLNSSGRLSLVGNIVLFIITLSTFSYLSSDQ